MNKKKIASELIKLAKQLVSADTFKCPKCGTKVLEQTGFCVKCKKKVKKASVKVAFNPDDLSDAIKLVSNMSRSFSRPDGKDERKVSNLFKQALDLLEEAEDIIFSMEEDF